jgi:hypothetical protein
MFFCNSPPPDTCHQSATELLLFVVLCFFFFFFFFFVLKHNSRADLTKKAGVKASKPQVKLIGRRDHQQVQLNHLQTSTGFEPQDLFVRSQGPRTGYTTEESSAWGGASPSSSPIITATATKVGLLVLCLVLCLQSTSIAAILLFVSPLLCAVL